MKDFYKLRIKSFSLIKYNVINIVLTDGSEYTADISSFQKVYCYPNETEWEQAILGGFGIHLDQIAGLALKQNKTA
jgi:hypothetical protein